MTVLVDTYGSWLIRRELVVQTLAQISCTRAVWFISVQKIASVSALKISTELIKILTVPAKKINKYKKKIVKQKYKKDC